MFVTLTSAMCLEHLKNFFPRSNQKSRLWCPVKTILPTIRVSRRPHQLPPF